MKTNNKNTSNNPQLRTTRKGYNTEWMFEIHHACYRDVACAPDMSSEDGDFDIMYVKARLAKEGPSFLTKTLPLLGKHLDRVLSALETSVNPEPFQGFTTMPGTVLPKYLGWLFLKVLAPDGSVLGNADSIALGRLRQILYLFYKLELPYTSEQSQATLDKFVLTDSSLPSPDAHPMGGDDFTATPGNMWVLARARALVHRVLANYDPLDHEALQARHGPGAVATGEKSHEKPIFRRYYEHLHAVFPYDIHMSYNLSSINDEWEGWQKLESLRESTAKVVLVPKDSRGPRIISCEPLEIQWIQQALMTRLVNILETHPLTRGHVNFKRQSINGNLALVASTMSPFQGDQWVTMDMKDASDRVSLALVRHLFPNRWVTALEGCRSSSTRLPDGQILRMKKFAPMGSATCFPVEALIFYAICVATQQYQNKELLGRGFRKAPDEWPYVYGDDLIIKPNLFDAIVDNLEMVHLKVNLDKCCRGRWFRESCGVDAFKGLNVTPLKIRRPLGHPSRTTWLSWIEYHNWFSTRGYDQVALRIRQYLALSPLAGFILVMDSIWLEGRKPGYAYLDVAGERPHALVGDLWQRYNKRLFRREYFLWGVSACLKKHPVPGWSEMLQRAALRGGNLSSAVKADDRPPSVFNRTVSAKAYEYARAHRVVRECAWYPALTA